MNTQATPPRAVAARNASASACMFMPVSLGLVRDFSGVEGRGKPFLFTVIARALPKAGTADAGRFMPADDVSVGVLADHVVQEQVLGDDGVAFHAHHLGDVGDAPGTVAQTSGLDDDVDRGADHLA